MYENLKSFERHPAWPRLRAAAFDEALRQLKLTPDGFEQLPMWQQLAVTRWCYELARDRVYKLVDEENADAPCACSSCAVCLDEQWGG